MRPRQLRRQSGGPRAYKKIVNPMSTMNFELTENRKRDNTRPRTKVLLVMDRQRRGPLLDALESCNVDLLVAHDQNEARRILKNRPPVHVLLTETTLRYEDWVETCETLGLLTEHVQIVSCCHRGALCRQWIAALELGAYDVLVEPYVPEEIQRVLEGAAARSYMRSLAARQRATHTLWLSEEETLTFEHAY
jgi:PleD family two-component response regulator